MTSHRTLDGANNTHGPPIKTTRKRSFIGSIVLYLKDLSDPFNSASGTLNTPM